MSKCSVGVALAIALALVFPSGVASATPRPERGPSMESELPDREPVEAPAPPAPPPADADASVGPEDEADAQILEDDHAIFSPPRRAAYRNLFDRSIDVDDVAYLPGPTHLIVDATTVLNGTLHLSMMSFAVVNRNPGVLRFDARMSFYPDLDGMPDVAHPIGRVSMPHLLCPPRLAIGVARLYADGFTDFELPPGVVWFGVEVSNIEGGDPALFGQIEMDNVTIGDSRGVVFDASVSPPAVVEGVGNLDRMIIPYVTCATDWQMDGVVDVRDFAAYLLDYSDAPDGADYNLDGETNIRDYVHFCVDYMGCLR